ncbi:hypothetical protein FIV42_22210 [Persicimonas caeni]|uniref:SCP domain-containing protein n=1 Tax=Persicimonas caeni TaxID=2292766 RepID=A0A4Y6PYG9_PERCE|nr:CAP domain-containing protein [Persicimonas caeni]QDG53361.1 hypothetical protein FIV42_22210 [Persicimonas caeni]QED34582.1 hypothetical protein FRD00_22205 [Persicimonas caeni]
MSMRLVLKRYLIALMCLAFVAAACSDDDDNGGGGGGALTDASTSDTDQTSDGTSNTDGSTSDAGADVEEDIEVPECGEGEAYCDYECRDILASTQHCGGCGMTCPSWNATCDQGNCICDDDSYTYCDGFCVDTQVDRVNCGSCGNTCAEGDVCNAGECKSIPMRVTEETNAARSTPTDCGQYGTIDAVGPLVLDPELSKAAQAHAEDMVANNFLGHEGSDGSDFAERIRRTNYTGNPVGENVAGGQRSSEEVVAGWVDSDGHCRNIMNGQATRIGVGYAEGNNNTQYPTYWVQVFGN